VLPRRIPPVSPSGCTARAPNPTRWALAGSCNVHSGLPTAANPSQNRSVLPPGAACATNTAPARSATNAVRRSANAAVTGRSLASNGDTISSRPSSRGFRHADGTRIPPIPRAGQITIGCRPRSSSARHSRSIAVRNPPTVATRASRSARARSYVRSISRPGHRTEQKRAGSGERRMSTLPIARARFVGSEPKPASTVGVAGGLAPGATSSGSAFVRRSQPFRPTARIRAFRAYKDEIRNRPYIRRLVLIPGAIDTSSRASTQCAPTALRETLSREGRMPARTSLRSTRAPAHY